MGQQTGQTGEQAQSQTIQGCLSGSSGNFTLTSDSGQTYQLVGTTDELNNHVGHEIQVTGTITPASTTSGQTNPSGQTAANTFNVSSVKMISDTCTGGTGATPPASSQTPPESAMGSQSEANPSAATNPAYPGAQPSQSAVGTNPSAESAAASGAYPSSGEQPSAPATAQTTPPSSAAPATGTTGSESTSTTSSVTQQQTQTTPSSEATNQTGTEANPNAAMGQTGQKANPNTAGQTGTEAGQTGQAAQGTKLPQTASPLPLMGLLGLGSLAGGLIARPKR